MTAPAVLESARDGQVRVSVSGLPRGRYATGQQEPCVRCAAAGIVGRLGVSRAGAGSPALCRSCWVSERQREADRERAELSELVWLSAGEIAAAEAAAGCSGCGRPGPEALPATVELLPEDALPVARRHRARRRALRRRHRGQEAPPMVCAGCEGRWLAVLRAEHERDLAEAAAAEAAAVEVEFVRMAARCEAEDRVAELGRWVRRLQRILDGYADPHGPDGSWGRAVELLAELLARHARFAAKTSSLGRPAVLDVVGVVMAAGADKRSGRRSMEGRDRTAELAGVSVRSVSSVWRAAEQLGVWVRTVLGRRLSLEERIETGRANDRTVFDWTVLHRGDVAPRAKAVPRALVAFGKVLQRGLDLLQEARDAVDELRERAATVVRERAAPVVDWGTRVRMARLRRDVARIHDTVTSPAAAQSLAATICTPHMVSRGEYLSSCPSWGLRFSAPMKIHSVACGGVPPTSGGKSGASRSPTDGAHGDLDGCGWTRRGSHPAGLPSFLGSPAGGVRPHRAHRPAWAPWAGDLAADLLKRWGWLAGSAGSRSAGRRFFAVRAVLGARLGPGWTAAALVAWVSATRGQPLLNDPDDPVAYLCTVLDELLTRPDSPPPWPARGYEEHLVRHRRRTAADDREVMAAAAAHRRRAAADRDRAALHGDARSAAGELQTLREGWRRRTNDLGTAGAADPVWPATAAPGAGLPGNWRYGDDRDDRPS